MADQAIEGETSGEAAQAMTPRATFRRLCFCGLTPEQAGNLTARLEGLRPIRDGWSVIEIERLVFLRWLIDQGRFAEDCRADVDAWFVPDAAAAWATVRRTGRPTTTR